MAYFDWYYPSICLERFEENHRKPHISIEETGMSSVNVREILLEMRKFRMGLIQTPDQLRFSYVAIIEGAQRLMNSNDLNKICPSPINANENTSDLPNSRFLCELEDVDNEESPPLPPPRGESLKKSVVGTEEHIVNTSVLGGEPESPPDKPLPIEPVNHVGGIPHEPDVHPRFDYGDVIETPQTLIYEDIDTASSGIRQRKQDERKERKERLSAQVREIKRKQEEAENWQRLKSSVFSPFNIGVGVGVGIILLGGGIFAYMYYSNKI